MTRHICQRSISHISFIRAVQQKCLQPSKNMTKIRSNVTTASSSAENLLPLKAGINAKGSVFVLKNWILLSLTLDGRDKITKTFQYLARFIAWYYEGICCSADAAKPYRALQSSLTNSRKAFRLGKFINELHKLYELMKKTASNYFDKIDNGGCNVSSPERVISIFPWKTVVTSLRLVGMIGFWAGDNVAFLTKNKFLSSIRSARSAQEFGAKCYFFACWMGLFIASNDLNTQRNELERIESEVNHLSRSRLTEERLTSTDLELSDTLCALEKAKADQFVIFLTLTKSVVDIIVFSNNPGVDLHKKFRGRKMNEGFHSLCGLVSAFVVLFKKFPDAASK